MHTIFVLHYYVSNKQTLCFEFDCNVSDKRTIYLYHTVTLVISARSVLNMIVKLLISAHYVFTLFAR